MKRKISNLKTYRNKKDSNKRNMDKIWFKKSVNDEIVKKKSKRWPEIKQITIKQIGIEFER